jgi:hypothetical protein
VTFDEQLQRALDTFTDRLRDEVAAQVRDEVARQARIVGDELAAIARAEADSARADVDTARTEVDTARSEADIARAEAKRATIARAEAEQAAIARAEADRAAIARADSTPAERDGATGRLAEAIRALGGARSLSEVLDTLVRCAGEEAARAGVLLVHGDGFHGWRGFDPAFASGDHLDIADGDAGVIAQALQFGEVTLSGSTGSDDAPGFAQLKPGQSCAAVPIAIGGQVVAVLYADAGLEQRTINGEPGAENREPGTLNLEPLEILTRFASQRLEALTAIKAARSLTQNAGPSPAASGGDDESAQQHAAARRYARLLVSEIKLYHEPQVAEGRRERDLATRLGGEIARVRTLYEQRVPAEVRQNTDYVHEELIRTLADGDASLLEAKT